MTSGLSDRPRYSVRHEGNLISLIFYIDRYDLHINLIERVCMQWNPFADVMNSP